MTTPAAAQQQQQQPTGQQQQQAVLAVAEVLATAATVAAAASLLAIPLAGLKLRSMAVHAALEVVMEHPPDREGFYGAATAQVARLNLIRRAQFMINSARRFNEVLARIAAGGADPRELLDLMARERRYYGQHQGASWNRMQSAARVDTAAMDYGPLLGWYAVMDRITSPECRHANRHNFRADAMPLIGFPGSVHPHCRCWPGPPWRNAPVLGGEPPRRMDIFRRQPVPA